MAKKKKKSASGNSPVPKRGISPSTLAIYVVIAVLLLILCILLGTAMDLSIKPDGKVDSARVGENFSTVLQMPSVLLVALQTKGSYAQKMLFLGGMVIGLFALYQYSESGKRLHRRGVEHGSAKWGDKREMKELADPGKPEFKPLLTSDGERVFDEKGNFAGVIIDNNILLTKEVFLSLNARQHLLNLNVLIIGGSGSGKTRFFAKPNIMQLNTSYVVTDPKGEILQSTGKMLTEAGYVVRVLNLIEMEHSNNYNPFHYVYDHKGNLSEDNIKKMVNVLFKATKGDGEKDDFWSQKGQTMVEALVFLLFEESEYNAEFDKNGKIIPETRDISHLNFFSVTEKMRRLQYPPRGSQVPDGFFLERNADEDEAAFRERQNAAFLCPLDKDFIELEKRKPDSLALRLYKEVRNAPEETGQSFLSSANVKTFMFNLTNLQNLTCCDNIELEKLGDRKTALFLILSATDSTYNFMAAMLYTQMFDVLANRANFKYGGTLPVHVRCIMDEFANIGQIPDFDKVIAYVRSMGISLNVIVQNLAQLKARYEKTWEVITGNCDSTLFLGGQEESTLKSISDRLDDETIDVRGQNRTKGRQSSTSENNSIMGRKLMRLNELSTMPITSCVLIMRSHNPFYCTKYPIEDHPNYKYLEDYDKNNAFDVSSIHSISVAEFEKQCREHATCSTIEEINNEVIEEQNNKIDIYFQRSKIEITYETYGDAELYADDVLGDDISEEYTDTITRYGELSELATFDLGDPIREPREEVYEDEAETTESSRTVDAEQEICRYAVPDEHVQHIEELDETAIEEAVISAAEHYAEAIPDGYLQDADEFDMEFEDDYFE